MDDNSLIDFDYILKHCDQKNHNIPSAFDKIEWKVGETYKVRIGNIYDPSKFWMVHHEQQLTLFQKYIYNFYNDRSSDYLMPEEVIIRNRYCVAYVDGSYYRGLIVDIPKFQNYNFSVIVYLFDFGFTAYVESKNIFYMYEKLYNIPQFAIRACLIGLKPANSVTWTTETVKKFSDLTMGKVLLCELECINVTQKIAFVRLGIENSMNQVEEINQILLEENHSILCTGKRTKIKSKNCKLIPKVKYPFLFPSHQALESSYMPSTVHLSELIKHGPIPASILYKPYFNLASDES